MSDLAPVKTQVACSATVLLVVLEELTACVHMYRIIDTETHCTEMYVSFFYTQQVGSTCLSTHMQRAASSRLIQYMNCARMTTETESLHEVRQLQ